jgi:2-polyprenyl-6-methoxyphenol hydroxylase-like FAD-dependent oxidoreductase
VTPLRIGVIGGGIAGLTAAVALRRWGHEPEVYERAPEPRASGGALIVWSGALAALSSLGLERAVVAAGTLLRSYEFRTWSGEMVTTVPVDEYARRAGHPCLLIARGSLHGVLEAAAREAAPIHHGMRLAELEQSNEQVTARFVGGAGRTFDLVVGADGLHSRTREIVQGASPLRTGRRTAWLGVVPFDHLLIEPGVAWTSIGPGIGVLVAGLGGGDVYWYATVPADSEIHDRDALAALLQSGHEPIRELVEATPDDAIVATPVRDRAPARPWSAGRVTLIGDSVHPSAPDLGQGACQAIESAVSLARHLAPPGTDTSFALQAYERERFARCARITALSRGALVQDMLEQPMLGETWVPALRFVLPLGTPDVFRWLLGSAHETSKHSSQP